MEASAIDSEWFKQQLERADKSVRALARFMKIDASAASRMLAGKRKMRLDEANQVARFLGVTTEEVLQHAGVSLEGNANRITLDATISESGKVEKLKDEQTLPSAVLARAEAAATFTQGNTMLAAMVRAPNGPLAIWDDAVMIYANASIVEPAAVGVLSIVKLRDGVQMLGTLEKARKTGEATIRNPDGKRVEVVIDTATPVLAVIP